MVSRAGLVANKGIDSIQVIDFVNRTNRWSRSKSTVCHHSVTTESGFDAYHTRTPHNPSPELHR
jgi:hypothetical protein